MQKLALTVLLLIYGGLIFGQNKYVGYWSGILSRESSPLKISLEFKNLSDHPIGFFNASSQRASGIPLDSVRVFKDSLQFQLMSEPVTYFRCKVSGENILGAFFQDGFSKGEISLSRTSRPSPSYRFVDTSFASGENRIACRIYFPLKNTLSPSVIFLHGSGPEGMFANQYLAEYLASKGIITLIQDKQGVGKSTGNWTTASFDVLTNDYVQAVRFLKTFRQVNNHQMGVYGHSQGGTLAPLLATKSGDISFVIAAASVGDSVYKQDLYRVENNLKSNDFTPAEVQEAMTYYHAWLDMARTGMGFDRLDSLNYQAKDKKWLDWVQAPPAAHWIWKYYAQTGNYNSLDYWKQVRVPVLLVYGEKDQIEDIKTYGRNIDSVLVAAHRTRDITEIILPRAQHNLCIFPEKNEKFFWWYLSRGYEDFITSWLRYRFKN